VANATSHVREAGAARPRRTPPASRRREFPAVTANPSRNGS
jgi:hypothetical protein